MLPVMTLSCTTTCPPAHMAPPSAARLPVLSALQLRICTPSRVTLPAIWMQPPSASVSVRYLKPFSIDTPSTFNVPDPSPTKMPPPRLPSIAIRPAPGPWIARLFCPNTISPPVNVMRLQASWVRSTVSSLAAAPIVSRRLPLPLSLQLVTKCVVAAGAGVDRDNAPSTRSNAPADRTMRPSATRSRSASRRDSAWAPPIVAPRQAAMPSTSGRTRTAFGLVDAMDSFIAVPFGVQGLMPVAPKERRIRPELDIPPPTRRGIRPRARRARRGRPRRNARACGRRRH